MMPEPAGTGLSTTLTPRPVLSVLRQIVMVQLVVTFMVQESAETSTGRIWKPTAATKAKESRRRRAARLREITMVQIRLILLSCSLRYQIPKFKQYQLRELLQDDHIHHLFNQGHQKSDCFYKTKQYLTNRHNNKANQNTTCSEMIRAAQRNLKSQVFLQVLKTTQEAVQRFTDSAKSILKLQTLSSRSAETLILQRVGEIRLFIPTYDSSRVIDQQNIPYLYDSIRRIVLRKQKQTKLHTLLLSTPNFISLPHHIKYQASHLMMPIRNNSILNLNVPNKRASFRKRRSAMSTDIETLIRQSRQPEYSLLQQTGFEPERRGFYEQFTIIKNMRIIEFLGRYKPVEEKKEKLKTFYTTFHKMVRHLEGIQKACEGFHYLRKANKLNTSTSANTGNQSVATGVKDSTRSKTQMRERRQFAFEEMNNSFNLRLKKELKGIQSLWTELFYQGSIKMLTRVLILTDLEDEYQNILFDIGEWLEKTQVYFQNKKTTNCCCLG